VLGDFFIIIIFLCFGFCDTGLKWSYISGIFYFTLFLLHFMKARMLKNGLALRGLSRKGNEKGRGGKSCKALQEMQSRR
jgi:hypothetical protein